MSVESAKYLANDLGHLDDVPVTCSRDVFPGRRVKVTNRTTGRPITICLTSRWDTAASEGWRVGAVAAGDSCVLPDRVCTADLIAGVITCRIPPASVWGA